MISKRLTDNTRQGQDPSPAHTGNGSKDNQHNHALRYRAPERPDEKDGERHEQAGLAAEYVG
jgi:hypothetical protein